MADLKIRTHVGRDILHSAQSFRTVEAAVWEYVVNSLQYVDPGVTPHVEVDFHTADKSIEISDNGRGMDEDGLKHFFTMHAENMERRRGIPGRGKFGTGKSAAFGIGSSLTVDTVRRGIRNVVHVDRKMIEKADGSEVPVEWQVRNEAEPDVPNGTSILIGGLAVSVNRDRVVKLIERYLSQFRSSAPTVYVGGRRCEVVQPLTSSSTTFRPNEKQAAVLGDVELVVKVATAPLEDAYRGVAVTVGPGNLVAVEAAGVDTKEFGNRLFGEIDVPELDNPKFDPLAPYGSNRDLRLNPEHPVALSLIAFIGASLEQARLQLVADAKEARKAEEMRRLAATANEIASVLNDDLREQAAKLDAELANIRKRTGVAATTSDDLLDDVANPVLDDEGSIIGTPTGEEADAPSEVPDDLLPGPEDPTEPSEETEPKLIGGQADETGDVRLSPTGSTGRRRPRGGLTIEYVNHGPEADRSEWDESRRIIEINLDHPVVSAALAVGGDTDPAFRRLSYEVAFTQYALALAQIAYEQDEALTASDALYEMREALRRVWARATPLYVG
jgi:hypothetical protein